MYRSIPVVLILLVYVLPVYSEQMTPADPNILATKLADLQAQFNVLQAQYRADMTALKQQIGTQPADVNEAAALRALAARRAQQGSPAATSVDQTTFKSGGLGLQALNPEISVTGDFLFSLSKDDNSNQDSDFTFRTLGVHLESWLDPYTQFKGAVEFHEDETELGEAYVILHNLFKDWSLTLGKFRQLFGVVNRWHKHGLDQVDFPSALRRIFGEGGLNQVGLSLDWMMPPLDSISQQLTVQVTDGSNGCVFGQNTRNRPSILAHYKNYQDLSKDTYLEWGLSALAGWNDTWDQQGGGQLYSRQTAMVFAADLSVLWEPTEHMRYRNIEWRSEAYWLNKDIQAPNGTGADTLNAWGLYSYLQTKLSRTLDVGVRGDFYQPDTKAYANLSSDLSLAPLAVTANNPYLWQIGPYITWWQSPFVKLRAEYNHTETKGLSHASDVLWFQAVFAAGPHKHERY